MMRISLNTCGPCVAVLSLALLTAGCERLRSVTTGDDNKAKAARTTLVKDSSGHTVRLDPVTGDVTPVDTTQAPSAAPQPRTSKRAATRATVVQPSVERVVSAPQSPVPAVIPTAAVTVAQPEVARVVFEDSCAEPLDLFAVTLVDIGIYEEPSVGSLVQRLVSGTLVTVSGVSDEWVRVNLQRMQGPISCFIHCSALRPLRAEGTEQPTS
jgi:hypothetical protein